jgi:hypothetical protein
LVAYGSTGRGRVRDARAALRLTDGVVVATTYDGFELCALIEGAELDRGALERRLGDRLGVDVSCGWSRFPDDALTLDDLVVAARRSVVSLSTGAPRRRSFQLARRSSS